MKIYGGVSMQIHVFLISALVGSNYNVQAALPLGERAPGIHWIGGWMGHRAVLNDMEE
jgi:hypothetical protein